MNILIIDMSDSLPNIYYASESNKNINLANQEQLNTLSQQKNFESLSQTLKSNDSNDYNFNEETVSMDNISQTNKKENIVVPKECDESFPLELSGTILSISNFSVSNENIVIGGITLYIKDDKGNTFEVQANRTDLISRVAERYRNVAKIDNEYRIFLMKKTGEGLHRQLSLEAQGIGDKDVLIAKQLNDEMRKKLKDKIKQGLTFFIIDSEFGKEAFYGKGNVHFKIFADKFREKYPGKKFTFRYSGIPINDEMKTIEELGFEQSERVFATVIKENE